MANNTVASTYLKINEDLKQQIEEISAISGIQRDVLRETFEFMLIQWATKIAKDPDKMTMIDIPFLGKIGVRYKGDFENPDGTLGTDIDAFVAPSDGFKKLVGDLHDEGNNIIFELIKKKINAAILTSSSTED